MNLLIVDDDPTSLKLLRTQLESEGHVVFEAYDGVEALALLEHQRVDAVISDVLMPRMDGYRLCHEIRKHARLHDLPIIIYTSTHTSLDDEKLALDVGADKYLKKPISVETIIAALHEVTAMPHAARHPKALQEVEVPKEYSEKLVSKLKERNAELIAAEAKFRPLVEQSIVGIYIIQDDQFGYVNPGMQKIFGWSEAEMTSRTVFDFIVPEEHALARENIRKRISGAVSSVHYDLRVLHQSGAVLEVEVHGSRTEYNGRPAVMGMLVDITERKRAEKAAQRSQKRLRDLIDGLGPSMFVGLMTPQGILIEANRPALAAASLKLEDVLGKPFEEAYWWAYSQEVQQQLRQAIARAARGEASRYDVQLRAAENHLIDVDFSLEPLRDETGEVVFLVPSANVITERKRAEQALVRLAAIIEATPDMVATGDPNGHVLYYNRAGLRMAGFEPGLDLSTVRFLDTHPEWAAKLVAETGIPHAIEHGAWSGETALLGRDGREIPISQVIIAHKEPNGSVEYLSTIARDITLQKEHEKHIMRLNRVYAVLSGINMTILRTRDRQELFDDACRIAVEQGKFRLVWIGLLDANGLDVTPVARAGVDQGYLDNIQLTAREDAPDRCEMVARALREKTVVVCNDIDTDPQMARWRDEALRRGYRSVVVFPLQLEDKVTGLLLLYASETGFFDTEEMRLLTEIAGDISFALDHLGKEDRLNYLAYYDTLTGLPNRSLLHDRLDQRVSAARSDQKTFAVVKLNLERFRSVNDTLGQHAGDELLRQVARRLKDGLDESDILARLGAGSFAIVTRCCDDDGSVGHILERVLSCIHEQPFEIEGQELRIAAKAGVAIFPHDGNDADTLLRNAEAALGKAKLSGDKYLFYAPEFNARVAEKLTLENKLRRALERGELVLHYQPKVELKKRRISGLEALMRWNDPDTGLLVPPIEFIPILEETGLILEAGRWALEQAIADSARWKGMGLQVPRIAVNVSAIQLRQKDFVATVERALRGAKDIDGVLELEITESLIMQDIDANIEKLRAIRDMGVEISVDDFGTGYSSLSYISRLPINALKIDRAFIINMTSKPGDLSIVSTIISLGHSLELKVVAEGVETEEQANLLRLLKCDEFQGYLFSRPVPAADIDLLLRDGKAPAA